MKHRLMDLLECPCCKGSLALQEIRSRRTNSDREARGGRCTHFCSYKRIHLQGDDGGYADCSSCTSIEISEGLLKCQCGGMFPIVDSIPRLLPDALGEHRPFASEHGLNISTKPQAADEWGVSKTRRSFSFEWDQYRYGNLTWESTLEERKRHFLKYLRISPESLRGKLVLDAGCGNGTLSAAICDLGVEVVGIDLSNSVERAEKLKGSFVDSARLSFIHFVQGSVTHPPFRAGSFDIVYSDGVLHHTPDTKRAFLALVPLLKNGGKYFVWLYRADLSPHSRRKLALIHWMQRITRMLPMRVLWYACLFGGFLCECALRLQYCFGKSGRRIIPVRLKAVNLFDTLSPEYDRCHTVDEVVGWFANAGFHDIADVTIPELAEWGFGIVGTLTRTVSG